MAKMEILEQFEYALPRVASDTEKLVIESYMDFDGRIRLTNAGGGTLRGTITANSPLIRFEPAKFHGNDITVNFTYLLDTDHRTEVIQTEALVTSNGGELRIPIIIRIATPLITDDGERLAALKDFCNYVKRKPNPARQLFMRPSFVEWLMNLNFEPAELDFYEKLCEDVNRERAVDNFLIMQKQKARCHLRLLKTDVYVDIRAFEKNIITGEIAFERVGWGFLEAKLLIPKSCKWVMLSDYEINGASFDDSGICRINYFIDTAKLPANYAEQAVIITGESQRDLEFQIIAHVMKPVDAQLSKVCYLMEDSGELIITNNSARDLLIELESSETFVKLSNTRFYLAKSARIPFDVRMSMLQSAQLMLTKQPTIKTTITLTYQAGKRYIERIPIYIGDLPYIEEEK